MNCSNLSVNDLLPLAKHISSSIPFEKPTVSYTRRSSGGGGSPTKQTSSEDPDIAQAITLMQFHKQNDVKEMNMEMKLSKPEHIPSSLEEITRGQTFVEEQKLTTKIYNDVLSKKQKSKSQKNVLSSLFEFTSSLPLVVTVLRWVADFLRVFVCAVIIFSSNNTTATKITIMMNTLTETFVMSVFINYLNVMRTYTKKFGFTPYVTSFTKTMTQIISRIQEFFGSSPYVQSFLNFLTVLFSLNMTTVMTTAGFLLVFSIIAPTLYEKAIPKSLRASIEKKYKSLLSFLNTMLFIPTKTIMAFFHGNSKLQTFITNVNTIKSAMATLMAGVGASSPVAYAVAVASFSSSLLGVICSDQNKKCKTVQFILSVPGLFLFWSRIIEHISETVRLATNIQGKSFMDLFQDRSIYFRSSNGTYICGNDSSIYSSRNVNWDSNICNNVSYKEYCSPDKRGFMLRSSMPQLVESHLSTKSVHNLSEELVRDYVEGDYLDKYIRETYDSSEKYQIERNMMSRDSSKITEMNAMRTMLERYMDSEIEVRKAYYEKESSNKVKIDDNQYDKIRNDVIKGHITRLFALHAGYRIESKHMDIKDLKLVQSDVAEREIKISKNKHYSGSWRSVANLGKIQDIVFCSKDNYIVQGCEAWFHKVYDLSGLSLFRQDPTIKVLTLVPARGSGEDITASASEILGKLARFGAEFKGLVGYKQIDGRDAGGALDYIMGQPIKYNPEQVLLQTYNIPKAPSLSSSRTKKSRGSTK